MAQISEEDARKIEQYYEVMQKGYYIQSHMVTALHNRIFDKNMPNTNCGSCLRKKINDLWKELQRQISKASVEAQENKAKEAQENKAEEKRKEENKDGSGGSPQKTKSRKKKSGSLHGKAGEGQGV